MSWLSDEQRDQVVQKAKIAVASVSVAFSLSSMTPAQANVHSAEPVQGRATSQQVDRSSQPTIRPASPDSERQRQGHQPTAAEDMATQRIDRAVDEASEIQEQQNEKRRRDGQRDGELRNEQKLRETSLVIDPKQDNSQHRDHSPPTRKR